MTSFASPATWLPAVIARAAAFTPSAPAGQAGPGHHTEPECSPEMFDATRDEDPFEWLGFSA